MCDADTGDAVTHQRYRYRRQHVIQSLLVSDDESEFSDGDSDTNSEVSDNRSR